MQKKYFIIYVKFFFIIYVKKIFYNFFTLSLALRYNNLKNVEQCCYRCLTVSPEPTVKNKAIIS